MRGFRINALIVIVAGLVLCVAAVGGIYAGLIQPEAAAVAAEQQQVDENKQYTQAAVDDAQKKLADAQQQAKLIQTQWDTIQITKNPNIDVSNRFHAWQQWTNELLLDFAPRVDKFLAHTGVQPLTTISAPAPPDDPNAVPTSLIIMPLGSISVFGSYSQILNHVAAWNRFDRIVVIDGLSLQGYSPFMTGTYTATEYIFPRNGDKPGTPVPSGSAPGQAGGPGAPGGAPPPPR